MAEIPLPPPIGALVQSINAGDTEGFLNLFTENGVVDDWGKQYIGHRAIRAWSDRELIGAKGVMTVRSVATSDSSVTVVGNWKSNYYTGPGKFIFSIEGQKVAEWRITGEQVSLMSMFARVRAFLTPGER